MDFEWHKYKVRGISKETGRKRTLKLVAQNREKAEAELMTRGLLPPYEFEEEEFEPPTDRQIDYAIDLGIKISPTLTKKDLSALISKKVDDDEDASEGLMKFAYDKNIYVSPYIGEKELWNTLFSNLEPLDKTAFFCFAVYRSMTGKSINPDEEPMRGVFYEFANLYLLDDSFQRSMEDYSGEEIMFFGRKDSDDGVTEYGGSKRKKAYQMASVFLESRCNFKEDNFRVEDALLDTRQPPPVDDNGNDFNHIDNNCDMEDNSINQTLTLPGEEFIVIENQVAMTEKPVAKLLGVTAEKLHELSRTVGVTNKKGGIYELSGQYVYTSVEIIFKVRDANGRNSADLSTFKLSGLFAQAEKRLLPKQYEQKENATMKKIVAGLLAICFVAFFISAADKVLSDNPKETTQSSTTVKQQSSPKVETVAEKPKPPPKPAKVLNLGMTFEQFKVAYRTNALAITGKDINVDNAQLKVGEVQDVFQSNISPNVIIQGSIDKASGLLKEIWIISKIETPKDAMDVTITYGLIMSVVSPELTAEQRAALMNDLKLNVHIEELATGKVQRLVGNVRYTSDYLPQGFFTFAASAKDL